MKLAVYTCVFGGYDWVFPPADNEPNVDYIIITDDDSLQVKGWLTRAVDTSTFRNSKSANLYYRALFQDLYDGYDYSLYIDGNIRLLGKTTFFFEEFISSGAALGLFRHPLRYSVKDEAEACVHVGKIQEVDRLGDELKFQASMGFTDDIGLIETTIILKNHNHQNLGGAMRLWWDMFERFGTRDQICLPYVIWQTDPPCFYLPFNFRNKNPYFGRYSHRADKRAPKYFGYIEGRAHDSLFFMGVLKLWRGTWGIRRFIRRFRCG